MYLNNFSVRVVESTETPGGYVEMRHGQTYTLRLRNGRNVRCDARVELDGKHVGTCRIGANSGFTLERPAHDTGRFTFYKLGTPEANAAQLNGGDPNLGLVRVTFTPEKVRDYYATSQPKRPWTRPVPQWPWTPTPYPQYDWSTSKGIADGMTVSYRAASMPTASAGGTGLSGASGQQFTDASHIDHDYSQQTVIHLRLVCKDDHGPGPRPLTSTSNPVPPRVW